MDDSESKRFLDYNYLSGEGVPKDYKQAKELFTKAVEQGSLPARIDLARVIFHGWGTAVNPQEAIDLLEPCLNNGYGRAYMILGEAFEEGLGLPQDYEKAKEQYQQALHLGYAPAQNALDRLDNKF